MAVILRILSVALSVLASMAVASSAVASSAEGHQAAVVTARPSLRHSWAQLTALELKIARQGQYWQAHGIQLGQWETSSAADKVVIHLASYSPLAGRQLLHRYGSSWVYVSSAPDRMHATLADGYAGRTPNDRFNDFSPFWGGDILFYNTHTPSAFCTSGFAVTGKESKRYMLTAGHCGSRTWYTNRVKKIRIGQTDEQAIPSGVDAQLMGGEKYEDSVWGKGAKQYPISGTFLAKKGDDLAFSGSDTGLRAGVKVIDKIPFCADLGGFDLCGLMRARPGY